MSVGQPCIKAYARLFGRNNPEDSEECAVEGKWPCSESGEEEMAGVFKAHVAPQERELCPLRFFGKGWCASEVEGPQVRP